MNEVMKKFHQTQLKRSVYELFNPVPFCVINFDVWSICFRVWLLKRFSGYICFILIIFPVLYNYVTWWFLEWLPFSHKDGKYTTIVSVIKQANLIESFIKHAQFTTYKPKQVVSLNEFTQKAALKEQYP